MNGNDEAQPFRGLAPLEFRAVYLNYFLEKERFHNQIAADYGKWLLASLIVLHGGGLLGLFSLAEKSNFDFLTGAGAALVIGLVLGLLAGFVTWLNWLFLASSYMQIIDHKILVNEEAWFSTVKSSTRRGVAVSFWLSLFLGVASAASLPIAAFLVMHRYGSIH